METVNFTAVAKIAFWANRSSFLDLKIFHFIGPVVKGLIDQKGNPKEIKYYDINKKTV